MPRVVIDDGDDADQPIDAGDDAGELERARWYEVAIAWGCFLTVAGFFVGCALLARACRK